MSPVSPQSQQPVWASASAFPKAPPESWGWLDSRGKKHTCESAEALIAQIRGDFDAHVILAWTPENSHMVLPEEIHGTTEAILFARNRGAKEDLQSSSEKLRWGNWIFGILLLWFIYQAWGQASNFPLSFPEKASLILRSIFSSMLIGVALLVFLIFAFIPWYQARKQIRELAKWTAGDIAEAIPVLRFETWLDLQKSPVTRFLLLLVIVVGLAQLLPSDAIAAAGLVKKNYAMGEYWRLFTAPFMHGNPLHFFMNSAALLYLGKRVEVFARWPHLVMVFLFSVWVGNLCSAQFLAWDGKSLGASGGLMGWLGFLLVFESLHGKLVPRKARRRLLAGVFLMAIIGLVGYRFIDNAAHAGGLIAGMVYAAVVFPKSSSPSIPRATGLDRVVGSAAFLALIASAVFALVKILW